MYNAETTRANLHYNKYHFELINHKFYSMRKLLSTIIIIMISTILNAQHFPDNSLGTLKKYSKSENTFTF